MSAISATFADYRTVKGRKILQIIMEVPLEHQARVFEVLGYPMPDNPPWVGIARLAGEPGTEPKPPAPKNEARSERAKEEFRLKPPAEQAVVRAARLCTEMRFQTWLERYCAARGITTTDQPSTETTAELLRRSIGVNSRREIAEDPAACRRFLSVEMAYKESIGGIAERRG